MFDVVGLSLMLLVAFVRFVCGCVCCCWCRCWCLLLLALFVGMLRVCRVVVCVLVLLVLVFGVLVRVCWRCGCCLSLCAVCGCGGRWRPLLAFVLLVVSCDWWCC